MRRVVKLSKILLFTSVICVAYVVYFGITNTISDAINFEPLLSSIIDMVIPIALLAILMIALISIKTNPVVSANIELGLGIIVLTIVFQQIIYSITERFRGDDLIIIVVASIVGCIFTYTGATLEKIVREREQ